MRTSAPRTAASRRAWRIAAAGALIAACALTACGSSSPSAPRQASAFIDLVSELPGSLDPSDEQGGAFDQLETSLASTLVRPAGRPPSSATLAPASAAVGFLATSWRELAGGDYVFDLRPGVRSPYGNTLTGADVSFSFTRELALSATARFLAGLARIALADPITVIAPMKVRLNVTAPSSLTLAILADFHFGVLDSRAVRAHESPGDPSARGWLATHLAFYAPYELELFDPGRELLLDANPGFGRPPAFSHVAIEAVASTTMRLADVGAAEASHTSELDWQSFQAAAHTSGVTAQTMPATEVSTLVPDERFRPFASVLVRRALSLAIDRTAIAGAGFGGLAKPALHPEPAAFALPNGVAQPTYTHDLALARTLLAHAGYPHGFSFRLAASPADGPAVAVEIAAITGELHRIGVTVTTRSVSSPTEFPALERFTTIGAVLETSATPIASTSYDLAANYVRDAPGNIEDYASPALGALAASLIATAPGAAAHAAAAQRALSILGTTYPVIPLVEIPGQNITLAHISGYAAYASGAVYYDLLRP
jgi:peptide/nickel transport system substrate-binding protein